KVIADKYGDGQATTGLNMMTDLITANPNLVGVFASNLILEAFAALFQRADARKVGEDEDFALFLTRHSLDGGSQTIGC
ncbi:hypothetical protein ACC675_38005, partial [Rhizobium ruizarguesonis]